MQFRVLPPGAHALTPEPNVGYLLYDGWDDWFEFETTYRLVFFDGTLERHDAGSVKIGAFNMPADQRRAQLPVTFENMPSDFFSLGQDEDYYRALSGLQNSLGIFGALNDIAFDLDLFGRAIKERVTTRSLMRSVPADRVRNRFHRLSRGDAALSSYAFSYALPTADGIPPRLDFSVTPGSLPPTNIHVLIGRNGVGKTRCLQLMTKAIVSSKSHEENGQFEMESDLGSGRFANLISVTFSAFDPFPPLRLTQEQSKRIGYSYIGLKKSTDSRDKTAEFISDTADAGWQLKTPADLRDEFVESATFCNSKVRVERWRRALTSLEADPLFEEAGIVELATGVVDPDWLDDAGQKFDKCSSGHKIVILTITRLVELVDEQSLVLMDEPEGHLHPPLLSAFVRALSDLLTTRNGVAIIATHSPVVLQEVPKSCVWRFYRSGYSVVCKRPELETFGENIGILTDEVFGLEVTSSGFHVLLTEELRRRGYDYAQTVRAFDSELGGEALSILRGLSVLQSSKAS